MAKIIKTQNLVMQVLQENEIARGDDYVLICEVYKRLGLNVELPLQAVFKNHYLLGLPSCETITRCRRKIQENNKDLCNDGSRKQRAKEFKEFQAYAINN